jgi:hypothetical protein
VRTPRARETIAAAPTATLGTADETPTASPFPTARPRVFDDVDQLQILSAVFPDLTLTPQPDGYLVQGNSDWKVWVNDRDEGRITQAEQPELLAVIANLVGANPPKEEALYGASAAFLVIMQRHDSKLEVVRREKIFPDIPPNAIDARIERIVDTDHDGQDELLATTNTVQTLIIRTEARLLRWENGKPFELWKGFEVNDNTAAVNQTDYSSYEATLDFADLDNNGVDELIVNESLTTYPKDEQGRADLTKPSNELEGRAVFKWNGKVFAPDPALTTPIPPTSTP